MPFIKLIIFRVNHCYGRRMNIVAAMFILSWMFSTTYEYPAYCSYVLLIRYDDSVFIQPPKYRWNFCLSVYFKDMLFHFQ